MFEAETPTVKEPVGVAVTEALALSVEEGVDAAVPVPDGVAVPVLVPLGV